jgi:hypothetical protein
MHLSLNEWGAIAMSTLAYAQLTTRRDIARSMSITSESPSGLRTYVDVFAALVPAEVLTLHGLILSVTTKVENTATIITDQGTLGWAFLGLIILSVCLYVIPRLLAKMWDRFDWIRMVIPPLALIGWTMLQRATAFDAVFPEMPGASRTIVALFLAVVLAFIATALSYKTPQKVPQS